MSLVLYLILVGFGITFAFLYLDYWIAIFVGVAVLFPVAAAVLSLIPCIFTSVTVEGEEKQVHKGEDYHIYFRLKNKSFLPITYGSIYFSFRYEVSKKWNKRRMAFQMKGWDECVYDLTMNSEYCGAVEIKVRRIIVKDFLRVFSIPKWIKRTYRQVVFPELNIVNLKVDKVVNFYNDEYEEFYEDHPGNDPSEVFEVREYKEGDKLQRIHWKLSSKKDKLMVKEFSDPIVIHSVIICDNYCTADKMKLVEEWSNLMEKTIQASYSLLLQKVNHYVYWFHGEDSTGRKKEIRTVEDLNVCMKELMQSKPYENIEHYINYLLYSEQVQNYTNIFYTGAYNQEQFIKNGIQVKVVE